MADAAEFVRAEIGNWPASYGVEVLIHAPIDVVQARIGRWATLEAVGDLCRMSMTTDSLAWAAMAVGSVGEEFEVLNRPELREVLQEWAARS